MGRIQPAVDLQHGNDQSDVRTNVPVPDQPGVQPREHHFRGGSEIARLTKVLLLGRGAILAPFFFAKIRPRSRGMHLHRLTCYPPQNLRTDLIQRQYLFR